MSGRPLSGSPNEGAPQERVDRVKEIAGDGDLDQRCRRILSAFRADWWGVPYQPDVRRQEAA